MCIERGEGHGSMKGQCEALQLQYIIHSLPLQNVVGHLEIQSSTVRLNIYEFLKKITVPCDNKIGPIVFLPSHHMNAKPDTVLKNGMEIRK